MGCAVNMMAKAKYLFQRVGITVSIGLSVFKGRFVSGVGAVW